MLVIFDLDGTIVDSMDEIIYSFEKAFENLNIHLDESALKKYVGLPLDELITALIGKYEQRIADEIRRVYYSIYPRKIRLVPGMEYLISHKNYKKAILTSKKREIALRDLSYLGIERYFDIIVGANDLQKRKPDPEGIHRIMQSLNHRDKKSVFMIGDTELDIIAAKRAGVKSIGVTWGARDENFLEAYNPDFIARTPEDIYKILNSYAHL